MYKIERVYSRVWLISGRYRLMVTCCLVSRLLKSSREEMIIIMIDNVNSNMNSNKYRYKDKDKNKDKERSYQRSDSYRANWSIRDRYESSYSNIYNH